MKDFLRNKIASCEMNEVINMSCHEENTQSHRCRKRIEIDVGVMLLGGHYGKGETSGRKLMAFTNEGPSITGYFAGYAYMYPENMRFYVEILVNEINVDVP